MLKHLYFIIFLTFITGFATGIYGYFMTNEDSPVTPKSEVAEPEEATGYEILATAYGGCERIGCASFRIREDGSYMYLAPDGVHSYEKFEDEISPRQRERLAQVLMSAPLARLKERLFDGMCPVAYDGIAYRFDIRRESETYTFDTCVEDVGEEELFVELIKYFAIMEATHLTP